MAKNLRAKIPASDTLIVRDVNEAATERFVKEAQEIAQNSGAGADEYKVEIATDAREIAEKSVSDALSNAPIIWTDRLTNP
jgi:3-hydroxyisobutyrate dehydrogenase